MRSLSEPGRSRVLVVDGGGSPGAALFGDRLAALAVRNSGAGAVVFGAVRNTEAHRALDPGIAAPGTNSDQGDVTFSPGRVLTCDINGIVVTP